MKHKIFGNIFVGVMVVFFVCMLVIVYAMYGFFNVRSTSLMESATKVTAMAIEQNGAEFLRSTKSDEYVFVYNSANGEKIMSVTDKNIEAMPYCQYVFDDGGVLRVYGEKNTIIFVIINIRYQLCVIFMLAVVLSTVLANKVSKSVIRPINEINIENPDDESVYEEIRPLVNRINAQNRQIKLQMDELKTEHEKQNRLRREFTANVSHELKTPLTSISGYAEIMRNGVAKPEDIQRFSGIIYDETQRLIALVGDIIDLSKLEEKDIHLEKTVVNLNDVTENVVSRLNSMANKKGITISVEGTEEKVYGVESILEEIVYNLCDNAIKYNKENGMVMINIQKTDGVAELSVTDTGIGIPEEELDRVFERFYRVDKSHSREIGGTGLGLSIVKHGVSYHGGEISIKSELGSGTSIKIRFTNKI